MKPCAAEPRWTLRCSVLSRAHIWPIWTLPASLPRAAQRAPAAKRHSDRDSPLRFVRLSYQIRFEHPGWPGNPTYSYEQVGSIEGGDVGNSRMLHLRGHFGSHVDGPDSSPCTDFAGVGG